MPDAATSQRYGYVQALTIALDPEQQEYISQSIDQSDSFDELPIDVQLWLEHAETQVGVAKSAYEQVLAQEASIDEQMP